MRRPEVRPGDFDRPVSTPDFESKTQLYAAMPRDILIVVSPDVRRQRLVAHCSQSACCCRYNIITVGDGGTQNWKVYHPPRSTRLAWRIISTGIFTKRRTLQPLLLDSSKIALVDSSNTCSCCVLLPFSCEGTTRENIGSPKFPSSPCLLGTPSKPYTSNMPSYICWDGPNNSYPPLALVRLATKSLRPRWRGARASSSTAPSAP